MTKKAIGIDVGGSHIKSAVVNLNTGELLESSVSSVKVDNKASAQAVFENWSQAINKSIVEIGTENLSGIGFAMPGPFNYKEGIALFEGNDKYESLYGLNIKDNLLPHLDIGRDLTFRFHNDASCFAIGEDGYGVAKGHDKFISITLGTGFGSSFMASGVPITNREDVPEDGSLWHLPFKHGMADDYFSTRWFINEYKRRTGNVVSGVKEIASRFDEGIETQRIFGDFGKSLGGFLSQWITRFEPEIVVMGGNISNAYNYFSNELHQELANAGIEIPFVKSVLKEDAAIIGSARLLDESYFLKIKENLPTK